MSQLKSELNKITSDRNKTKNILSLVSKELIKILSKEWQVIGSNPFDPRYLADAGARNVWNHALSECKKIIKESLNGKTDPPRL